MASSMAFQWFLATVVASVLLASASAALVAALGGFSLGSISFARLRRGGFDFSWLGIGDFCLDSTGCPGTNLCAIGLHLFRLADYSLGGFSFGGVLLLCCFCYSLRCFLALPLFPDRAFSCFCAFSAPLFLLRLFSCAQYAVAHLISTPHDLCSSIPDVGGLGRHAQLLRILIPTRRRRGATSWD